MHDLDKKRTLVTMWIHLATFFMQNWGFEFQKAYLDEVKAVVSIQTSWDRTVLNHARFLLCVMQPLNTLIVSPSALMNCNLQNVHLQGNRYIHGMCKVAML